MNTHRHAALALIIAAAVVMVGCASDDTATTTTATPSTTVAATTTTSTTSTIPETTTTTTSTSTSTTSTTAPDTTVPVTVPEGRGLPAEDVDWVAVIQHLVDVRDELYATADPTRTSEVCVADSFLCQNLIAQLTDAQERGLRYEGVGPIEILSATLDFADINEGDGIEFASVRTEVRMSDQFGRIVDANGDTYANLVPNDPDAPRERVIRWTLINTELGWLLFDQERVS